MDSDDLIAGNVLGKLKQIADEKGCDRISFNYYSFHGSFRDDEAQAYRQGTLRGSHTYQDANVWTSIICIFTKAPERASRFSGSISIR